MKLLNTALIKLTLFLVLGICAGFYWSFSLKLLLMITGGICFLFSITYLHARKQLLQDSFFGILCCLLFFSLGVTTTQLHLPQNQPKHYSNLNTSGTSHILLSITEQLKPDRYRNKFVAEVKQLNGKESHGRLLILLPKEIRPLEVDGKVWIQSRLDSIPKSLNPQQFNYRRFMENRGVLFQTEPAKEEIFVLGKGTKTLAGRAENTRSKIVEDLKKNRFEFEELAIIQALLLGQRQDISTETYEEYAAAGVIHILAVSGLHVGIILMMLHSLLSPLNRWKHGRFLKSLLLIICLWGFAVLAGLSPSVVRAVTMFSFLAVGLQLKRQTSVLNTLFLSLLLLLLLRPQFLFEVGFQLSYLAVFSIVLLQPILSRFYRPKNRILKYFWNLLTVTLAAQIGVMPLSLFYFHQFPGLFFLSNLVILPFLGIILFVGILSIILSIFEILPQEMAEVYSFMIQSLNSFVEWVAKQESFLFQDIPFSGLLLFVFYGFLCAFLWFLTTYSRKALSGVLLCIICLQISFLYEKRKLDTSELVVFHKSRTTVLAERNGKHLKINHNLQNELQQQSFIRNYKLPYNPALVQSDSLRNVYRQNGKLILILDSSAVYRIPDLKPAVIILINSPKINMDRLILELQPQQIVADASNYKSYVVRWKETCLKQKIPFHYTGEKGAFIIK